jgi:hypothetical protein
MRVCTLLGLLGGLFLVGWVALSFFFWRREKEASRRHKEQLRLVGTGELFSRAWNWGALRHHEEHPSVKEFRVLLEQHRYGEMLEGWRALTASLFALEEHVSSASSLVYDSDSFRALRDYVEVLHERQQRGE